MVCSENGVYLHHFAVSVIIFLIISTSSHLRLLSAAEGRRLSQTVDKYSKGQTLKEEDNKWSAAAMILRGQIGSRPPRCERRCSSCGRCEAVQVPTNPQTRRTTSTNSTTSFVRPARNNIAYARDDNSNYKPMSWKCKCGNLIFNP